MKKEAYFRNTDELDDSLDESDGYSGPGINTPKRSPMRRKAKFRTKEFNTEKKHHDRKRNYRSKYDFMI